VPAGSDGTAGRGRAPSGSRCGRAQPDLRGRPGPSSSALIA